MQLLIILLSIFTVLLVIFTVLASIWFYVQHKTIKSSITYILDLVKSIISDINTYTVKLDLQESNIGSLHNEIKAIRDIQSTLDKFISKYYGHQDKQNLFNIKISNKTSSHGDDISQLVFTINKLKKDLDSIYESIDSIQKTHIKKLNNLENTLRRKLI